jgi:hypothetical protein
MIKYKIETINKKKMPIKRLTTALNLAIEIRLTVIKQIKTKILRLIQCFNKFGLT